MRLIEEMQLDLSVYDDRPRPACWVYEVWTPTSLAYVGITDNFEHRWAQHESRSWWLGEVIIESVDVRGYASRRIARMWEAAAINEQSPLYNASRETPSYLDYQAMMAGDDDEDLEVRTVLRRYFRGRTEEYASGAHQIY